MLEVSRSVTKEPLRCWSTSTESPSKSSSEYGAPLTWNSSVSAIRPWAPTMPSDGLATMEGSGSKGGVGIKGPKAGLELPGEAVVQTPEVGLARLRQIEVGEQLPQRDGAV